MNARWVPRLTLLLLVAAPAWPAQAGGGGHACQEQSEGTGSDVVIADACFQPSLLHVDAGTEVSFLNKDPFGHNVYGTGWAVGDLAANGGAGSASFADEGIYPFQCSLHPGMTGAIVVGSDADQAAAQVVPTTGDGSSWLPGGIAGIAIGIAIGIGGMWLASMRSRRREPAASLAG